MNADGIVPMTAWYDPSVQVNRLIGKWPLELGRFKGVHKIERDEAFAAVSGVVQVAVPDDGDLQLAKFSTRRSVPPSASTNAASAIKDVGHASSRPGAT